MDRYYYDMPGRIPSNKYYTMIPDCDYTFVAYDENKVSSKFDKDTIGCWDVFDDESGKLLYQDIRIDIPKNIFRPDLQYVCVKQNKDTSLQIVAEESLKKGDVAVRLFLPYGHFVNTWDRMCFCDDKKYDKPIEIAASICVLLIPGRSVYLNHI